MTSNHADTLAVAIDALLARRDELTAAELALDWYTTSPELPADAVAIDALLARRDELTAAELDLCTLVHNLAHPSEEYEYEQPDFLPDGWGLAIYPDGRALVCSPGTCPAELGGHELASASRDQALFEVRGILRVL